MNDKMSARELLNAILFDVQTFSGEAEQHDDMTLVVLEGIVKGRGGMYAKQIPYVVSKLCFKAKIHTWVCPALFLAHSRRCRA